jgi:release factor glutamine methyltransferase
MTIAEFQKEAQKSFEEAGIPSARLDSQVLLERALKQNKAWLLAHGDEPIPTEKLPLLQEQARRRAGRQPLAYILGRQEFYGRNFVVSPAVLIPRPATEQLIEDITSLNIPDGASVLDVGTGSGAIATTVALELPHTRVEACDISPEALDIAESNAERLGANVRFFESDLLERAEHSYDVIVANLPYVATSWERSPETDFEPKRALFAEQNGLELIKRLLLVAPNYLNKDGFIALEADPRQFGDIKRMAINAKLTFIRSEGYAMLFRAA